MPRRPSLHRKLVLLVFAAVGACMVVPKKTESAANNFTIAGGSEAS